MSSSGGDTYKAVSTRAWRARQRQPHPQQQQQQQPGDVLGEAVERLAQRTTQHQRLTCSDHTFTEIQVQDEGWIYQQLLQPTPRQRPQHVSQQQLVLSKGGGQSTAKGRSASSAPRMVRFEGHGDVATPQRASISTSSGGICAGITCKLGALVAPQQPGNTAVAPPSEGPAHAEPAALDRVGVHLHLQQVPPASPAAAVDKGVQHAAATAGSKQGQHQPPGAEVAAARRMSTQLVDKQLQFLLQARPGGASAASGDSLPRTCGLQTDSRGLSGYRPLEIPDELFVRWSSSSTGCAARAAAAAVNWPNVGPAGAGAAAQHAATTMAGSAAVKLPAGRRSSRLVGAPVVHAMGQYASSTTPHTKAPGRLHHAPHASTGTGPHSAAAATAASAKNAAPGDVVCSSRGSHHQQRQNEGQHSNSARAGARHNPSRDANPSAGSRAGKGSRLAMARPEAAKSGQLVMSKET